MANQHGAAAADDPMGIAEREATFVAFVALTETVVAVLLSVLLALVLWGLEGHGFVALVGLILTFLAAAVGALTGLGWRLVAPVFLLLGVACIVL
ncbi:MAG: aa3-type cytochrome c oxidase subunit IV [Roseiarcus sp.]|jgi:hypothetical protein